MGGLIEKLLSKKGIDRVSGNQIASELWKIPVVDIEGNKTELLNYTQGKKAFIFVNVACKWGLTSDNYTQLVDLYQKYGDQGLQIFGFPCGQFMNQELSTEKQIKNYVNDNFKVDFPMFGKIELNGPNAHPIYNYLKYNTEEMKTAYGLKNIPWNFTKFLVNKDGKVVAYYPPKVKPEEMTKDILQLL